jgi:hypothetical protein
MVKLHEAVEILVELVNKVAFDKFIPWNLVFPCH